MRTVRAEGHISSKAPRVHFAKDMDRCPHQIPAYKAYLVPGDRFIITKWRDALICAIYFLYQGKRRIDWQPADPVAYEMAAPIALTDWVGK
jgi:hypothetical protein